MPTEMPQLPDVQKYLDMLAAMQLQRDQALNALVGAQAENAALRRTVTERGNRINDLEAEVARMKNDTASSDTEAKAA